MIREFLAMQRPEYWTLQHEFPGSSNGKKVSPSMEFDKQQANAEPRVKGEPQFTPLQLPRLRPELQQTIHYTIAQRYGMAFIDAFIKQNELELVLIKNRAKVLTNGGGLKGQDAGEFRTSNEEIYREHNDQLRQLQKELASLHPQFLNLKILLKRKVLYKSSTSNSRIRFNLEFNQLTPKKHLHLDQTLPKKFILPKKPNYIFKIHQILLSRTHLNLKFHLSQSSRSISATLILPMERLSEER